MEWSLSGFFVFPSNNFGFFPLSCVVGWMSVESGMRNNKHTHILVVGSIAFVTLSIFNPN